MLRLLNRVVLGGRNMRTFSVQTICNTSNDEFNKKRQILELEMDLMKQEGKLVPSQLKENEWSHLLELPSLSARRKYYTFLFKCEMTNLNLKAKKEIKAREREERLAKNRELAEQQHIVYGLGHNSMFLKIYETTMNLWHNNKLVQAMQFEPKIVIDCSYDDHMTFMEANNCAKQLIYSFASNRIHNQPLDIHFCNFDVNSKMGTKLNRAIPTMFNADFPMNVHADSYLDHFDKNKLVYLTPHCREEMAYFNPDDIYIIGAMVDKAHNEPISVAKAKKHGIRMAKFPLDRFFQFQGGKCLTINQAVDILLEMKVSQDWKKALTSSVPKRKINAEYEDLTFEEKLAKKNQKANFYQRGGEKKERSHFSNFTKNIKTYNKRS